MQFHLKNGPLLLTARPRPIARLRPKYDYGQSNYNSSRKVKTICKIVLPQDHNSGKGNPPSEDPEAMRKMMEELQRTVASLQARVDAKEKEDDQDEGQETR